MKWFTSENVDDNQIWEALNLSGADKFINELLKKLIQLLVREVCSFQRAKTKTIFIKIFSKISEILILDEATSSLDSLSENEIQNALNNLKLKGDITFLIIAHRLSTIKKADEILLLDDGRVKEKGNYSELKSISNGKFNLMLKTQITNN